jgi:hypothetical protein
MNGNESRGAREAVDRAATGKVMRVGEIREFILADSRVYIDTFQCSLSCVMLEARVPVKMVLLADLSRASPALILVLLV